jgi:hypothetical protein
MGVMFELRVVRHDGLRRLLAPLNNLACPNCRWLFYGPAKLPGFSLLCSVPLQRLLSRYLGPKLILLLFRTVMWLLGRGEMEH